MSKSNQAAAPPFCEGDVVKIKDNDHLGLHRVDECEWYTPRDGSGYWIAGCSEMREVDWDKILPGQCGIVMPGYWSGLAAHLEIVPTPPEQV